MELDKAKEKFIQSWGSLGSNWGINRTIAQIHALLIISSKPLCSDEIMESLNISRGNVNMNIRSLLNYGLAYKTHKSGDRKEYFEAEKDFWLLTQKLINIRRQREIEPLLKLLDELSMISSNGNKAETDEFRDSIEGIKNFANHADKLLGTIANSEEKWFWSAFMSFMKK